MLWSVGPPDCFATLAIPDFIRNTGMRDWDMRDREERKGVYEQMIRRGSPQQMIRWMDGALLVDVWDELDLPDPVRKRMEVGHPLGEEPLRPDTLAVLPHRGPGPHLDRVGPWIRAIAPTSATAPAEAYAFRPAPAAVSAGRAVDGRVRTDSVTVLRSAAPAALRAPRSLLRRPRPSPRPRPCAG